MTAKKPDHKKIKDQLASEETAKIEDLPADAADKKNIKDKETAGAETKDIKDKNDLAKNKEEKTTQDQEAEETPARADELTQLNIELAQKKEELEEVNQKYLRLAAEYDNFRRRTQKEKEDIYTSSIAHVLAQWLPVLDNLDRAAKVVEEASTPEAVKIAEGLDLVHKQACKVMADLGVSEIECLNESFDPNLHDAVMHVEDDSVGSSTVVEVLQKGYQRGEQVIRHSVVKVAN